MAKYPWLRTSKPSSMRRVRAKLRRQRPFQPGTASLAGPVQRETRWPRRRAAKNGCKQNSLLLWTIKPRTGLFQRRRAPFVLTFIHGILSFSSRILYGPISTLLVPRCTGYCGGFSGAGGGFRAGANGGLPGGGQLHARPGHRCTGRRLQHGHSQRHAGQQPHQPHVGGPGRRLPGPELHHQRGAAGGPELRRQHSDGRQQPGERAGVDRLQQRRAVHGQHRAGVQLRQRDPAHRHHCAARRGHPGRAAAPAGGGRLQQRHHPHVLLHAPVLPNRGLWRDPGRQRQRPHGRVYHERDLHLHRLRAVHRRQPEPAHRLAVDFWRRQHQHRTKPQPLLRRRRHLRRDPARHQRHGGQHQRRHQHRVQRFGAQAGQLLASNRELLCQLRRRPCPIQRHRQRLGRRQRGLPGLHLLPAHRADHRRKLSLDHHHGRGEPARNPGVSGRQQRRGAGCHRAAVSKP